MNTRFEYITTGRYNNFSTIEIEDVLGFIKYAEANSIKFMFRIEEPNDKKTNVNFFFNTGNIIFKINSMYYKTVEDYADAVKNGFPTAEVYYDAIQKGCSNFSEYEHLKKLDIKKMDDFILAQKNGFVKGFEVFKEKLPQYKRCKATSIIPEDLDNPILLMEYANAKGFKYFKDFEKVYELGFPDIFIYKEALSKGFKIGYDFYTSLHGGFHDSREYEDAKKIYIYTKHDYDNYRFFKDNCLKDMGHDEFQVLEILKLQDNGSILKLDEIRNLLNSEQEKYKITFKESETKVLPIWYFQKIAKNEDLEELLKSNELIKRLGFYYVEKNYFEIFRISKTKIYIDASNVARYNSNGTNTAKLKLIKIVTEELKSKGFTEITAIADATLKHISLDFDEIEHLKKEINYCEVPSHTEADEFIIENARNEKCLIISNDTFNDWKIKDKWIAHNIDSIRIPFIITEGKVTMPGLSRYLNGNSR